MDVLLVGLEGFGLRTLERLLADGHRVTCVATPEAGAYAADAAALGAAVVPATTGALGVLREAGLETAAAVVVAVEDDVANLHCALAAGVYVVEEVRVDAPTSAAALAGDGAQVLATGDATAPSWAPAHGDRLDAGEIAVILRPVRSPEPAEAR